MNGESAGKVYFYNVTEPECPEICTKLGEAANDEFGRSLGISNTFAIVGSRHGFSMGLRKVYVYKMDEPGCPEVCTKTGAPSFGAAVAVGNQYAIVGEALNNEGGG